eukprot:TRINITY_DN34138_c0_g3_i1.p1 TRINITY_DN34138_c0_g3~~TRINITY_DN34138_c0_g3_i1.p1  ORF type:complete len:326 (+),score=72.53 TRINITY_DN34138_c0_g3_i1:69-1046(+)
MRCVRWRRGALTATLLVSLASFAPWSLRTPTVFLQSAEWAEKDKLDKDDELPLIADVSFDIGTDGEEGRRRFAGRGSYVADFGLIDLPVVGDVRARAGLRYSQLYSKGALELGVRKEVSSDEKRGYELYLGAQTAGDDSRLDVLCEVGALKYFKRAKTFYRFMWGWGQPYKECGEKAVDKASSWSDMGSSLGVTQTELPPGRQGELTVGWRTGLFSDGPEAVSSPSLKASKAMQAARPKQKQLLGDLNSTPYISYGITKPMANGASQAKASWTVMPEHDVVEHALRFKAPRDASGGSATFSAIADQSISQPSKVRLRFGASYMRG